MTVQASGMDRKGDLLYCLQIRLSALLYAPSSTVQLSWIWGVTEPAMCVIPFGNWWNDLYCPGLEVSYLES